MREKHIYRRYLSMAMTAVMTIQLCAPPEAVWGAAAHKKVKIITEFAELPESVSHIQIPAGVEETELEQYLQFPETLEAYIMEGYMETGSSDHKKATDSNARMEEDTASATSSDASYTVSVPESVYGKATDSNTSRQEKATSSNIEERSASDPESDEDDAYFEEEDLFADIPVLTDIAVTWEQDEEREAEDGSMYYLPVLPTEYVLADGVELPEIQVSVDYGIALMNEGAIQVTMNGQTSSYASFDDWMSNGTVEGDCEIKLMENTVLIKALTFNSGTITLDLNGKTLDTGSNNIIIGSSSVTIRSDGAEGTITGTQTSYNDRGIIRINTGGNCIIKNNVKIQHTGNSASRAVYNGGGHLEIEDGAEFSVYNGSFSVEIYYGTATITGGTFHGGVVVKEYAGKVEISGGTFYPNGSTLGSLRNDSGNKNLSGILKQGYGLQKVGDNSSVDLEQTLTKETVRVVKYPIYFSTQPVIETDQATVLEGYQTAPQLTAEATTENSVDEITYQWHVKKTLDGTEGTTDEVLTGANSGIYQISAGLSAGTYEYYCVATHGNDTVASNGAEFTVTQGYVQTVINRKTAGYLTLQEALTAIDNAVANAGNANTNEITIELKFLADSINRTEVTWTLDGTNKMINLTVDLNGCKAGYSPKDGKWNSAGLTFTLKGVHAVLKDSSSGQTGYLNGFLIMRDQASLTVESGSYENLYLYSEARAALNGGACRNRIDAGYSGSNGNTDAGQNAGISCTITGGIYQNVNVYGGASLTVSGDNTRIEKTLKAVHYVGGSSDKASKRAEVSLGGGYYNKIQVELADSNDLNDTNKKYAVADMLSSGYVFFASGFLQTVARTATFVDQVTVVPADTPQDTGNAVAKIVITTQENEEITNYYSSWESAVHALSQGDPDATRDHPTTWKKVELLLLKDATASTDVGQITNSGVRRLPDDITVSSAEGGNYTLTGSSDSKTPILLWADNIQNLTVKNIKLTNGRIYFVTGSLTISQGAEIISNTTAIGVKGTLIIEKNANVRTNQSEFGAIQLLSGGTMHILGSDCQISGVDKEIYFSGDAMLVLESGAVMPKLGKILDQSNDHLNVICKDPSQVNFNNADTGVKLWYPVTLPAGTSLETSGANADTVKEYEGQIYGLGWADGQEGQKEINVDTGICSYVQTNDSNSVKQVISSGKFQMPAAAVTLLKHELNEYGVCVNCGKVDLETAYQNGHLHMEGLTGRTYDSHPQKLVKVTLNQADGTAKELNGADADDTNTTSTADFTTSYANNISVYPYVKGEAGFDAADAPRVTITGQGNYMGMVTVYFTIGKGEMKPGTIHVYGSEDSSAAYDGQSHSAWSTDLSELKFKADPYDRESTTTVDGVTYVTAGNVGQIQFAYSTDQENWISKTVEEGQNQAALYDITNAGRYRFYVKVFNENCNDQMFGPYTSEIQPKSLKADGIVLSDFSTIANAEYTGEEIVPGYWDRGIVDNRIKVTSGGSTDSYVLRKGTDFTTSAVNNINVGKATIKFTGINNYTGELTANFMIVPKKINVTDSNFIGLEASGYGHTGEPIEPAFTLKDDNGNVISAEEYTVTYKNNTEIGTATIEIAAKEGRNYSVSGSTTFEIKAHTHHWNYQSNGYTNFMQATCDSTFGTCPYENGRIYLILYGRNQDYDGNNKEVQVNISFYNDADKKSYDLTAADIGVTLPEIVYYQDNYPGGQEISGVPVNAGEYWGVLTMGEGEQTAVARVQVLVNRVTPQIVNVAANSPENTLDLQDVILTCDPIGIPGKLKLKDDTVLEYGSNTCTWVFEPGDSVNYKTVEGSIVITIKDTNSPTVQYRKDNGDTWEDFNDSTLLSSRLWNINDTMEIWFRDAESGIATQQYYVADQVMVDSELSNAEWVNYTTPFKLGLGSHIVYVKAIDHYGNQVILHSDNFVVYQESVLRNTEIEYFYKEGNEKVLHINMNGNTFKEVVHEENQPLDESSISIETEQGQLTLNPAFLDSLGVGLHSYKIRMWPRDNREATPLEYEFCVTVNRMPLEVDGVRAAGRSYNGSKLLDITEVILKRQIGSGSEITGVSVSTANLQGTLESADAGNYSKITLPELTLTGTEADKYELIQPTAPVMILAGVTITKASAPTITWPAPETIEVGNELQTSKLTGGSTEYGTFAWKNPSQKAEEGTHTYEVTFTPNPQTEKNYDITELTEMVSLQAVAPASTEHEGEIAAAAPKVAPVAADAPQEVKDIADVLQNTPPAITGLETAAKDLLQTSESGEVLVKTGGNQTITGTEAKEILQNEGINTAGKTVKLVVEPYMEVAVKGVAEENGKRIISMEISAKYNVKATTARTGETMQESGTGRNSIVIGTGIQYQVDTPVTITIPLPADYPVENLFICHILHSGKNVYYPVTVTAEHGVNMAEFVNKDGFSTFELLSDGRNGYIVYDQEIGTRSYTLEQVGDALPTVNRSGYRFKGWKINGTIYTEFTLELLNLIDAAEGKSVAAEAVMEQTASGSQNGGSGNGSSTSGSRGYGSGSDSSGSVIASVSQGSWSAVMADGITKWRFADPAGVYAANTWKQISWNGIISWYHFGADGFMNVGWLLDTDGHWYYFNPVSDGTQGTMITGWRKIDGIWYYFNPVSDGARGAMYHDRRTPDGYYVVETGAWDGKER